MTDQPSQLPARDPVLRVVPMPADVNQHGDIFGGWIMNLLRHEKTQARIAHTLATGKPLRN